MGQSKRTQSAAKSETPKQRRLPNTRGEGGIEERFHPKTGIKQYRARKAKAKKKTLVSEWFFRESQAWKALEGLAWKEQRSDIPSLRQFMKHVLSNERKTEVAGSTYTREDAHFRTRIFNSDLGRKQIDQITDVDCQKFLDQQKYKIRFEPKRDEKKRVIWVEKDGRKMQKGEYVITNEPLGPNGAREIAKTLAVYFKKAKSKRYGYIKASPLVDIEYPKQPKNVLRVRKSLTESEAQGLEENLLGFLTKLHLQGDRFKVMVLTLLETGLRPGELRDLKWHHLLKGRDGQAYLMIEGARTKTIRDGETSAGTKTGAVKTIPIDEVTYDRLKELPRSKQSDFIFHTTSGMPVGKRNFNRDFQAFRDKVGLPNLTPKNLRHTYASLLLRQGVSPKAVQGMLRHTTPKMVMEVYGHAFDEEMAAAPARLRDILTPKKEEHSVAETDLVKKEASQ